MAINESHYDLEIWICHKSHYVIDLSLGACMPFKDPKGVFSKTDKGQIIKMKLDYK